MKQKKKLTKAHIATIISTAVVCLAAVAIIITNLFIPVKYLSAYVNFSKDKPVAGELRVSFIDVGYGDSTLIELPDGKCALIDAGNGRRANQIKILKLLNKRSIDKIDFLICSSVAEERCGGLAEILKYKKVGRIIKPDCTLTRINGGYRNFSEQTAKFTEKYGSETVGICGYGEIAVSEEYTLCFLSPSVKSPLGNEYTQLNESPTAENVNNSSAVIWLEYKNIGFFLAGDVTSVKADKLYTEYKLNGYFEINGKKIYLDACKILKCGNHGDKSSVSPLLYELLNPQTAIISVGENGRSNPSAEALVAVQKYVGDEIYLTQECGTVTVTVSGGDYTVAKEKK